MQTTLILGGTTEASQLAQALASAGLPAVLSYAGRVANPRAQPVPTRHGGFGGIDGLATFLRDHHVGQIIDATHPFAAQISRNALAASVRANVPYCAFEREPWAAGPGDDWLRVPGIVEAAEAIDGPSRRIFLAIGRQHLSAFAHLGQHHFLTRLVDAPDADFPLADAEIVVARGPFAVADDIELMRSHGTELIVAKNAGGAGAEAKIEAARQLGLRVIMIDRPAAPDRTVFGTLPQVLAWLHARLGV